MSVFSAEGARAARCTGRCARYELIACLWLFEFIDAFIAEVGALCMIGTSGTFPLRRLQQLGVCGVGRCLPGSDAPASYR